MLAVDGPMLVMVMVYVRFELASTLVAPDFVVEMFACGVMVVMTFAEEDEPLLLDATGSPVAEVLDTMLVIEPLAFAVMVMVKFVAAAFAKFVSVGQVTTPLFTVPPPDALTKVAPAGNVSLTTTLLAVEGPILVTVMV